MTKTFIMRRLGLTDMAMVTGETDSGDAKPPGTCVYLFNWVVFVVLVWYLGMFGISVLQYILNFARFCFSEIIVRFYIFIYIMEPY